jgi:hypothetical protein
MNPMNVLSGLLMVYAFESTGLKAFTSGNPGGAADAMAGPIGLVTDPNAAVMAAVTTNRLEDIGRPPLVLKAECTSRAGAATSSADRQTRTHSLCVAAIDRSSDTSRRRASAIPPSE